jgi:chemotaxis protein histidine kinase CheA
MAVDITQFQQTFFEESFEGLAVMESGLLHLEVGTPDLEVIHTIFRAVHSIKGGSGTFGFLEVMAFRCLSATTLIMNWLKFDGQKFSKCPTWSVRPAAIPGVRCGHLG